MRRLRLSAMTAMPVRQRASAEEISQDLRTIYTQIQANFQEIEQGSSEERIIPIASAFAISNFTEKRDLDASTATLQDVANVLCTLINDMKRGSTER